MIARIPIALTHCVLFLGVTGTTSAHPPSFIALPVIVLMPVLGFWPQLIIEVINSTVPQVVEGLKL